MCVELIAKEFTAVELFFSEDLIACVGCKVWMWIPTSLAIAVLLAFGWARMEVMNDSVNMALTNKGVGVSILD